MLQHTFFYGGANIALLYSKAINVINGFTNANSKLAICIITNTILQ